MRRSEPELASGWDFLGIPIPIPKFSSEKGLSYKIEKKIHKKSRDFFRNTHPENFGDFKLKIQGERDFFLKSEIPKNFEKSRKKATSVWSIFSVNERVLSCQLYFGATWSRPPSSASKVAPTHYSSFRNDFPENS